MADKIKGALFNALDSLNVVPEMVLDLYAGTGSIGIEALSRGATRADFVDQGREQCATIRANLESTGFARQARVHQKSVMAFIQGGGGPYDFVILDPPYAAPDILEVLAAVGSSPLVQSGSIIVIGHWPRIDLPDQLGRLDCLRHRCHGDSCFSIYDVVDQAQAEDTGAPQDTIQP